ncbi:hypothetical protein O0L34_g2712 [Tuta absoluta]|nr:hypothetical protein O0L34_g2712 [Tuta absoluta]
MSQVACVLAMVGAAAAQFALDGVRCGQLTCKLEEYCSQDTQRCAPCSVVCNHTSHNYDSGLCNKECLGYLLDQRYMRKSEVGGSPSDLSSYQRQAQAALIVSGVALAVLVLVLAIVCRGSFSWRYLKQKFQPAKNRVKTYPSEIHANPHAEMPKPKHELKLEIRNPDPPRRSQPLNVRDLDARTSHTEKSQGATTPKTISTALSNRHPAEDTTLDFSYDNMGMNVTPPEQPAASHKF